MMRSWWVLLSFSLGSAGCMVEESPTEEQQEPEEHFGEARDEQITPFKWGYIKQSGTIVAASWHGQLRSGPMVELWAMKPGYSASAARTFDGQGSTTCSSFRSTVCGWTSATYYEATYAQSALNCASPPSAFLPPGGSVSFLASGSYGTTNAFGTPFAWTYTTGNVEYWAMSSLVDLSSGVTSIQSPLSPGYSSFNNFVSTVCAMGTPPSTWFSAYYTQLSNFCSVNPC
jgi:hypothetical protein